ncbi:hypothetical protein TCON_2490 [Astathelohania contejeani]|uniref:DDT domain-containing protein n=1 Tax=Astathelohania contejeani TaxID=164912 RepID=A0ABQ7HVW0_9MICR|nr:hypothetical protein TCON_2490 [Thelohania contejeani]
MLESNPIKKYIVRYFLENSSQPLTKIVNHLVGILSNSFILDEIVFVKNRELTGKILDVTKTGYMVGIFSDSAMETDFVQTSGLMRRDQITKNEVMTFLQSVTRDTPLGRELVVNVLSDIKIPLRTQRNSSNHKHIQERDYMSGLRKHTENIRFVKTNEGTVNVKKQKLDQTFEELLEEFNGEKLEVEDETIIRIHGFFSLFGRQFKIPEFSMKELINALHEPEYNSKIISNIHVSLLSILSQERKAINKTDFKNIIEFATNKYGKVENGSSVKKENKLPWYECKAKKMEWKTYVKAFLNDIANTYNIEYFNGLIFSNRKKENINLKERLNLIDFLLECCIGCSVFKSIVDSFIEKGKKIEKEKYNTTLLLRKKRSELKEILEKENSNIKKINDEINKLDKKINDLDKMLFSYSTKLNLGQMHQIPFLLIDNKICYKFGGAFRILKSEELERILKQIKPKCKDEAVFLNHLKWINSLLIKC